MGETLSWVDVGALYSLPSGQVGPYTISFGETPEASQGWRLQFKSRPRVDRAGWKTTWVRVKLGDEFILQVQSDGRLRHSRSRGLPYCQEVIQELINWGTSHES